MKARLTAHGRQSWEELQRLAEGMDCFWTDYDGVHVGEPAPAEIPPATHFWAWGPDRWIRARIDVDEAIIAELTVDGGDGDESVEVVPRPFDSWERADRVGFRPTSEQAKVIGSLQLLEVVNSPMPLAFVGERDDS